MRSIDKKTSKGKFVIKKGLNKGIYPFILIMDNPKEYYKYVLHNQIKIRGVATYPIDNDDIEKIEIEKIEPL